MENKIEECPQCGNYVEGKIVYSGKEKVARAATSKGVSVYVGGIIGAIIGTPAFPIGTVVGFIIGMFISSTIAKSAADSVGDELFKDADFVFTCPKCGKRWTRHLLKNHDSTPTEVLQKELDELYENLEYKYQKKLRSLIINLAITIFCFCYCWINNATYETVEDVWLIGPSNVVNYNYGWLFCGFLFLIFLPKSVFKISKVLSIKKEMDVLENMELEDFRNSSFRKNNR